MALTETDTSVPTSARDATGRRPPGIWVLQYGPCWCRAEPGETESFDFVRFRTAESSGLDRNLIIVSERVIIGSGQILRQVHDGVPEPRLVIATGHCRATGEFWDGLPGGWAPVEEMVPVDVRIGQCISGYPEVLLAAVLDVLSAGDSGADEPARQAATR